MGDSVAGGAVKESVVENRVAVNMEDVVHQSVFKFDVPSFLICIAQAWPCWLPSILSFHLGIKGVYFPSRLHKFFPFSPSIVNSAGGIKLDYYLNSQVILFCSHLVFRHPSHYLQIRRSAFRSCVGNTI